MEKLESRIGYAFQNRDFLNTAITHSSYANENKAAGVVCNERLEFLGDAVLGYVTAEYLYERFPDLPEGRMTRLRAELVCERSLNFVATQISLGEYLRLGRGEENNGGRARPSIKADAVEALLAAIYLDGGIEPAKRFVRRFIFDGFEAGDMGFILDYKTDLQELVQKKSGRILEYRVTSESGPDHDKTFIASVALHDGASAQGEGKSKKEAEQMAAKAALEMLHS